MCVTFENVFSFKTLLYFRPINLIEKYKYLRSNALPPLENYTKRSRRLFRKSFV